MAVETGLNWLYSIDITETEATSLPFTDLPQQKGGSLAFSKSDVDATNKENSGWEDYVSTRRGWSGSVDGQSDDNDSALEYLIDTNQMHATLTDRPVRLAVTNDAGDTWVGWATMESFDYNFDEQDLVNYSVSFKGRSRTNTGATSVFTLTRA